MRTIHLRYRFPTPQILTACTQSLLLVFHSDAYIRFDVTYPALGPYTVSVNLIQGSIYIASDPAALFQFDVTVAVDDAVYTALQDRLGSAYQGDLTMAPLIEGLLARTDALFNDPGVFSKTINFRLKEFYPLTTDPCDAWYAPKASDEEVRLVISNVDNAACNTGIISERRIYLEALGLDGLFENAGTDVVLAHESAHAIGMYDIYGLEDLGYKAGDYIMVTANPDAPIWHPTSIEIINLFINAPDIDAIQLGRPGCRLHRGHGPSGGNGRQWDAPPRG